MLKLGKKFSKEDYRKSLINIKSKLTANQVKMLNHQYDAPDKTISATELTNLMGYRKFGAVNLQYGKIGRFLSEYFEFTPPTRKNGTPRWWMLIANGIPSKMDENFKWIMHPELAMALKELGWIKSQNNLEKFEEILDSTPNNKVRSTFIKLFSDESARRQVLANFIELIEHAHSMGSDTWGVHSLPKKIRLLVGRLIVATIQKDCIWIALGKNSLEKSTDKNEVLNESESWQWDTGVFREYKVIPTKNGYFSPNHSPEIWSIVKEFNFKVIEKSAIKFKKLYKKKSKIT
ncbi:MAG: hypothetical protein KAT34_03900 [Candidatus Aminicenantes bacterium]|nr:hypothetical protein [Candidatus Aminicenantes bacterium]